MSNSNGFVEEIVDNLAQVLGLCQSLSDEEKAEILKSLYPSLPPDTKAELLKHLLDKEQQLQVTFGNCQIRAQTVYQLNLQNPQHMADILAAIATNIKSENT